MIAKFIGKEGEPITRKELKAFQKRISLGRKTRIKRKALGQIDQLLNKKVKHIPNLKHNKPFKDEIKKRNAQKLKRKSSYQKREVVLTGLGILDGQEVFFEEFENYYQDSLNEFTEKEKEFISYKIEMLSQSWSVRDTITYDNHTFYEHRFGNFRLLTYFTGEQVKDADNNKKKVPMVLILYVFRKSTQKTPESEKKKAIKMINEYEQNKNTRS